MSAQLKRLSQHLGDGAYVNSDEYVRSFWESVAKARQLLPEGHVLFVTGEELNHVHRNTCLWRTL